MLTTKCNSCLLKLLVLAVQNMQRYYQLNFSHNLQRKKNCCLFLRITVDGFCFFFFIYVMYDSKNLSNLKIPLYCVHKPGNEFFHLLSNLKLNIKIDSNFMVILYTKFISTTVLLSH